MRSVIRGGSTGGAALNLSPSTIDPAATGAVAQLGASLTGSLTFAKLSGASSIAIAASGVVTLSAALGAGGTASFVARAANQTSDAVERAFTLTGAVAAPTPTPTPTPTPVMPAAARPPTFGIAKAGNAWGDSTTFGVGAPTGHDIVARMRAGITAAGKPAQTFHLLGTSSAIVADHFGNGGQSGQNTTTIAGVVTYCANNYPAEMQGRLQFFSGGLNDYNSGVPGWSRNWPAQVRANFATMVAGVGTGSDYFVDLAPLETNFAPGHNIAADHAFHRRDMIAAYGARVNHQARWLRFARALENPDAGSADTFALSIGAIPYSCRGYPTAQGDFADLDPVIVSGAGAPTDTGQANGSLYWNTTANTMYRKGAGGWQLLDVKHQGRYGNSRLALMRRDMQAAQEGSGPPYVIPMEMRCAVDAPAGAVVGQLLFTGAAAAFAIGRLDAGVVSLDERFAVSTTGQITRTASGALTDGAMVLVVAATNGNGTLYSPVDLYVTRASTAIAPSLRPIVAPGVTVAARWGHGMVDGGGLSFAMYVSLASVPTAQGLINLVRSANAPLYLSVLSSGQLRMTIYNAAGTQTIINTSGLALAANSGFWLFGTISAAAGTAQLYVNDASATLSTQPPVGTLALSDCNPTFLAAGFQNQLLEPTSPLIGAIGGLWLWDSAMDWSVQATRRALMNADLTPVAGRAPYSPVASVAPKLELWGSKGDWLFGTPDGSNGSQTMSISHRARTLMS